MSTFGPYTAKVVGIHDGDTILVDVLLISNHGHFNTPDVDHGFNVHRVSGVGVVLERQSVRLLGINAPELSTDAGRAALEYIKSLLPLGTLVELTSHGWDKYGGRIDGAVLLPDGRDLSQAMVDAGHAVKWDGTGVKPVGATA